MSRSILMELPSLAKEGWLRPLRKSGEGSLAGADGWFVPATDYRKLNEPPRPRFSKERGHLLDGASTPPWKGGEFHSDASRHFRFIVFSPNRLFCLPRRHSPLIVLRV